MTNHPVEKFFKGSVWSILGLDDWGGVMIHQAGLTIAEARNRLGCSTFCNPEYAHQMHIVSPPDEDRRHEHGIFGVVYMISGSAFIQVIGITEDEAERIAKDAMDKYGPDAPSDDWSDPDTTGCRKKLVNVKPMIQAAYAIDMPHVMESLGLAVPV